MKLTRDPSTSHLHQVWQWLTRFAVGLVIFLSVGLSAAGIPARRLELISGQDNFSPLVPGPFVMVYTLGLEILLALVFFSSAAVIAAYRSGTPMTLFLGAALAALGATETGMSDALINPLHSSAGDSWRVAVYALRSFAMGAGLIMLYTFPDGRFTPRWTRPLALVWGTLNILWFFFPTIPFNPNDGPTWRATPVASLLFGVAWFGSGIAAQVLRGRSAADPIQRQQTLWSAYGLSAAVVGGAIFYGYSALKEPFGFLIEGRFMGTVYVLVRPTIKVIGMGLLPACLGVAILRYRLFDIDLIINRTLLYTLLTGLVIGGYLLVAGGVSALLNDEANHFASILAAGVVAVLFHPLRERLQRGLDRMFFGERDSPYRLLSELGQKLESAYAPQASLSAIVETIGRGLKLPYTAIAAPHGGAWRVEAEYRKPGSRETTPPLISYHQIEHWPGLVVPVTHQGRAIGRLLLSQRAEGESFSRADLRILEDLARQAGLALHAIRLQSNLQRTHQRLVNAREEERRRLWRDLHDDLGPTLASLTFRIDAARNLVKKDPQRAEDQLEAAASQSKAVVDDIRRLVNGLRPPALDELGLVQALAARAELLAGVPVRFVTQGELPALPAAVEAAAYYIVTEALNNAARHARAQLCEVRLTLENGCLQIEARDDGRGLPDPVAPGSGLQTMRERAEELGGVWTLRSIPGGGVCVQASLPLDDFLPGPGQLFEGEP